MTIVVALIVGFAVAFVAVGVLMRLCSRHNEWQGRLDMALGEDRR